MPILFFVVKIITLIQPCKVSERIRIFCSPFALSDNSGVQCSLMLSKILQLKALNLTEGTAFGLHKLTNHSKI